ncbi:acetylornithine/succinylornithine family transaminase [Sinimarinibacterium sp. NLF-5-8]|nr:acetylornithine/succinyldiaminopimelate transaminase [Sinimarinibacterium sp. NLF-5-8]QHS10136.1 acetylornithine/succinylornithine family transaminase [Sinimarinibacterium sp. NLF-5-8]
MSTPSRAVFDQVMVPNYQPAQRIPVRGLGSRIWDQDGREYVDFAAGIAVTALGHANPRMVAALTEQANRLWHVSNVMTNEPALRLAQRLIDLSFADKVFFCNSGGEANEAAFKLARRRGNTQFGAHKNVILSFEHAFHGRTLFTVSVGGQPKYTQGFEPLPGGIRHLPFNDLAALKAAMNDTVCAVVMEPLQGEGGILPADPDFVRGARALCDQYDALLIFDEVQTGNGRTGRYFAYEQIGVAPDVLTTAKGLGGGFPIAAMLTTDACAQAFSVGSHGSTYGGNPLACAVADVVVEQISKPETLENVRARADQLMQGLTALSHRYPDRIAAPRGQGLLIGIPLLGSWQGKAGAVVAAAMDQGLWMLLAGPDVLRLTPALTIGAEDVAEGLLRLERALAAV